MDSKMVKIGQPVPVDGELTIRGVTKKVNLKLTLNGPLQDPWGNKVLIFKLKGILDRREYGISWNKDLIGKIKGKLVGNEVEIDIQGEANPNK
jgi:polyisoprenoid-binding protein YceI